MFVGDFIQNRSGVLNNDFSIRTVTSPAQQLEAVPQVNDDAEQPESVEVESEEDCVPDFSAPGAIFVQRGWLDVFNCKIVKSKIQPGKHDRNNHILEIGQYGLSARPEMMKDVFGEQWLNAY